MIYDFLMFVLAWVGCGIAFAFVLVSTRAKLLFHVTCYLVCALSVFHWTKVWMVKYYEDPVLREILGSFFTTSFVLNLIFFIVVVAKILIIPRESK